MEGVSGGRVYGVYWRCKYEGVMKEKTNMKMAAIAREVWRCYEVLLLSKNALNLCYNIEDRCL